MQVAQPGPRLLRRDAPAVFFRMKNRSYVKMPSTHHGARGPRPAVTDDRCYVRVVHLVAVRTVRAHLPKATEIGQVVDLFALLSNPTRLKVLLALRTVARSPQAELCVCDLAVLSGVSPSMTSHQLRLLREAGLVVQRREGKLAFYRLAGGTTARLLGNALDQVLGPGTRRSLLAGLAKRRAPWAAGAGATVR